MLRRASVLLLGSGVWAAANGASALIATSVLDPDDRGHMVVVLAVASLVSTACGFGSGIAFRMYVPRASDPGIFAFTYWCVSGALGVLSALAGSVVAWSFGLSSPALLFASAVTTFALLFSLQLSEFRFGIGEFQASGLWAAGAALSGLVGIFCAILVDGDSAVLLLLQNGMIIAACLVNFGQLCKRGRIPTSRFSVDLARLLMFRGFSPLVWTLGILVLSRADRLVLARFEGPEIVAVYALGVTLSEIVRMFPTALSQFVTREMALGATGKVVSKYIIAATVSAVLMGIVSLPLSYLLVKVALDPIYLESLGLLAVLLVGEVAMAFYLCAARGLQGLGDAASTARIGTIVAVSAVPVYALGAYYFGGLGVAVVLASCYSVLGASSMILLAARLRRA